jgi:putative NADH-flavin reductase
MAKCLDGHDVVLSALGVRPPAAFRPHTLVRDGAASTVRAMNKVGTKRLVLVSAAVLFPMKGLRYAFFRRLLRYIADDLGAAEAVVRTASLDWTIVRPPRLTGGSGVDYRALRGSLPQGGFSMSFRAVAAFMLDAVERHSNVHEIVGLVAGGG